MTLRELAERLGCRLEGDGSIDIRGVAGLEQAREGDLTFFANPRYTQALRTTRASAVIAADNAPPAPCAILRAKQPALAFANAVSLFAPVAAPPAAVHDLSFIAPDVTLGRDVSIGPFSSIGRGARVVVCVAWVERMVHFPEAAAGSSEAAERQFPPLWQKPYRRFLKRGDNA